MLPLQPGDPVRVKVVLAKPNEKWAVAASAEGRLFVLQVRNNVLGLGIVEPFHGVSVTGPLLEAWLAC